MSAGLVHRVVEVVGEVEGEGDGEGKGKGKGKGLWQEAHWWVP